jgi:hypothetical protein
MTSRKKGTYLGGPGGPRSKHVFLNVEIPESNPNQQNTDMFVSTTAVLAKELETDNLRVEALKRFGMASIHHDMIKGEVQEMMALLPFVNGDWPTEVQGNTQKSALVGRHFADLVSRWQDAFNLPVDTDLKTIIYAYVKSACRVTKRRQGRHTLGPSRSKTPTTPTRADALITTVLSSMRKTFDPPILAYLDDKITLSELPILLVDSEDREHSETPTSDQVGDAERGIVFARLKEFAKEWLQAPDVSIYGHCPSTFMDGKRVDKDNTLATFLQAVLNKKAEVACFIVVRSQPPLLKRPRAPSDVESPLSKKPARAQSILEINAVRVTPLPLRQAGTAHEGTQLADIDSPNPASSSHDPGSTSDTESEKQPADPIPSIEEERGPLRDDSESDDQ